MAHRVSRSIGVSGLQELHENAKRLMKMCNDRDVEQFFLQEAQRLQTSMRGYVHNITYNLFRGIVAKLFDTKIKDKPAAFVAIDYRVAPHAHLVEFGTVHAKPHPFFRKALRGFADSFYNRVAEKINRKINEVLGAV